MSPTERTLKHLREKGILAAKVETWNAWAKIRQDLFGFIDILYWDRGVTIGAQVTTQANQSARVKKICGRPKAEKWLFEGNRIEVWGWRKRKGRWNARVVDIVWDRANGKLAYSDASDRG